MRPSLPARTLLVILGCLPVLASAHPGHEHLTTFAAGLMHPVTGLDHLLAMVAIGVWAQQLGGRSRWSVPVTFIACLMIGATLGANRFNLGPAELVIALSVLTLGALIARAQRLPWALCLAVSGTFALFHGYAHGTQIPVAGDSLAFVTGFTLMTLALHLTGVGIGTVLSKSTLHRWAGTALALAGGVLLIAAT